MSESGQEGVGVSGRWQVRLHTPRGIREGVLELVQDGDRVTGRMDQIEILDVRVDGDTLAWTAELTKPFALTATFTAKVIGDTMSGKARAKSLPIRASFDGTRA